MRITIITPTRNRARMLPAAIESVLAQGYPDFEHIIMDALSTDETPEVVARYPHLHVVRAKDAGHFDALNKALKFATGDFIGHLNDDDVYRPGTFQAVAKAAEDPRVEAIYGGAEILDGEGKVQHRFLQHDEIALTVEQAMLGGGLTNARFFHRELYRRVGGYDLGYPVTSDREFLVRVALAAPRSVEVEQIFYEYRSHEGSLTFSSDPQRDVRWREEHLVMAERLLAQAELPGPVRRLARRWHARETAHLAADAFVTNRWPDWHRHARQGLRANGGWPVAFLRNLPSAWLRR